MLNRRFALAVVPLLLSVAVLACSSSGPGAPPTALPGAAATSGTAATQPTSAALATAPAATAVAIATNIPVPGPVPAGFSSVLPAPQGADERTGLYAQLVLDDKNNPIIAYEISDLNGDGEFSDSSVLVTAWDAVTGTWTKPVEVAKVGDNRAASESFQISLARDAATGALALAYVTDGLKALQLAHSTDGGATWTSEPVQLLGTDHDLLGPVVAIANGATFMAVSDQPNGEFYLTRQGDSGTFTATALPILPDATESRWSQVALALDSAGKPALAFWQNPASGPSLQLAFWRPGETAPHKVADTHETQNDNPFVALTFAGDQPVVAFQAILGYDASNFATGTVWSVTSSDGVTWNPVNRVPDDGGQTGDGPFPLVAGPQGAALAETVSGGNLDGTKCGLPQVARTTDFKTWATCSPDANASLGLVPFYMDASLGSDGKLSLVIQNRRSGQLPAGVLFWREK
jgi:hypothetical protein